MFTPFAFVAALSLLTLTSPTLAAPAPASPPPPSSELTAGDDTRLWRSFGFRAGPLRAHYEYENEVAPGHGETGTRAFEDSSWGAVIDLELSGGYRLSPRLGIGLGADLALTYQDLKLSETELQLGFIVGGKLAAVWRLDERLSISLGGGIAAAGLSYSQNDIASADNIVDPELVFGPYGSLGLGYGALSTRLLAARLSSEHSTYVPIFLTVGAQFAAW